MSDTISRDLEYFGEDSNFCPDCGREWSRCPCSEDQDPYEAVGESRFGLPERVGAVKALDAITRAMIGTPASPVEQQSSKPLASVESSWVEQYVVAAGPDGFESVLCASLPEARQQFIDCHLCGTPDANEEKRLGEFFDDDENWVFVDDTRVSLDCRYEADRVSVMRITRIRATHETPDPLASKDHGIAQAEPFGWTDEIEPK